MKNKLILMIAFFTTAISINAQVTDTIDICFDKSIYLVFDDNVTFDFGSQGIIVKEAGNKVIIQAAEEDFPETNLLIQCGSQFFLYIIRYNENPKKLFYNYQNYGKSTLQSKSTGANKVDTESTQVKKTVQTSEFTDHKIENVKLQKEADAKALDTKYVGTCTTIMKKDQAIFNRGTINGKMQFMLTNIYIKDNEMYLKLSIANKSKIPYNIGFIEHQVESVKRTVKGSANQVVGVKPLYVFNEKETVEGKKSQSIVVVIKKIAIQKDKKLVVNMWEDNGALGSEGGRKLSINIMSSDILNVKEIK